MIYTYTLFAMNKVVCSPNVLMLSFFWRNYEVHNHLKCNYEKCLLQNKSCISIEISISFLMAMLANRLLLLIMIKTSPPSHHSSTWWEENAQPIKSHNWVCVPTRGEEGLYGMCVCVFISTHTACPYIFIYVLICLHTHLCVKINTAKQQTVYFSGDFVSCSYVPIL